MYARGADIFACDVHLLLASARLHEEMGLSGGATGTAAAGGPVVPGCAPGAPPTERAAALYRHVLSLDAANVEALACLAAQHFYGDQPEVALRHYRRLLQIGINAPELWANLGLATFYAGQYDMALSCLERALAMASDDAVAADVWYGISHVAVGIGDLGLAYQACRVAVAADPAHAEAYNSLGVLDMRRGNTEAARANFATAARLGPHLHEPLYNGALLSYKLGDFAHAYAQVTAALAVAPDFADAGDLAKTLRASFVSQ